MYYCRHEFGPGVHCMNCSGFVGRNKIVVINEGVEFANLRICECQCVTGGGANLEW